MQVMMLIMMMMIMMMSIVTMTAMGKVIVCHPIFEH